MRTYNIFIHICLPFQITYFRCKPKFGMFVPEAKARRLDDPLTLEVFQTANEELGCGSCVRHPDCVASFI